MFQAISKLIGGFFKSPAARKAVTETATKAAGHVFRKFPAQHGDKAVRAAFKVGVAVGKKAAEKAAKAVLK